MAELDPALQRLVDRQEIVDVLLRYVRGADRRDGALMHSCYHADAVDEHGMFDGPGHEFVDRLMASRPGRGITNHMLGQSLIEIEGEMAVAETYFLALHRLLGDASLSERDFILAGRYIDRFERRDGVWKIAHRRAVLDQMRMDPAADDWNGSTLAGKAHRGEGGPGDFVFQRWAELGA